MKHHKFITGIIMFSLIIGFSSYQFLHAAEDDDIELAITNGISYLVSQQHIDGGWYLNPNDAAAYTGFVLTKLQDRAYELGISPFDEEYEYFQNVIDGWEFLFYQARTRTIRLQDHRSSASGTIDDPDTNGNGIGIAFGSPIVSSHWVYTVGVTLMALEASGVPDRVNEIGADFDSDGTADTYFEITQDASDWLIFAQGDLGVHAGGWRYYIQDNIGYYSDNSVTGYAVLGLAAAEGFGCTVPQWVKTMLEAWIGVIQYPVTGSAYDGGSRYVPYSSSYINELKTGNLIFEMTFVGIAPTDQMFQDAMDFIVRHWNDTNTSPGWGHDTSRPDWQAMFCLMKGFEYSQIDLLDFDDDGIGEFDWFEEFADVIIDGQHADGYWIGSRWANNPILDTVWALLTIEKIFPNLPPVADAGPDQFGIEQTSHAGAQVTLDGSGSYDPNDDPLTYNWTWGDNFVMGMIPTITLPLGLTTINLTVFDGIDYDWDLVDIEIVDTTIPEFEIIDFENTILWPPNHKYHTIDIAGYFISVSDICDADVGKDDVIITKVTSDEPEDVRGNGDGKTFDDIVITGDQIVDLRAERQGKGNGRVYTIFFKIVDGSGNVAMGSIIIEVPHNVGSVTIDDGPAYAVNNT
ncbi:MAG: hypothetical protein GPJ54_01050 [Candidatus Heimdallarchaeota archaeon]|nr:hypothetical protein [Candidatus Heimdallarchaeota archaeon]